MKGYKTNIESETWENKNYRKVMYTGEYLQLVIMNLKVGEDIGEETHENNDQFFRIESGFGKCIIEGHEQDIKEGDAIIVPAGARHNIINTDVVAELKMYTIYGPPNHQKGVVELTKKEATVNNQKFDGITSENNKEF